MTLASEPYMISNVLLGIALVLAGRQLFWLFVGTIGFLGGFELAEQLFINQPVWWFLLIAVVCATLGIIMAVFFQRIAVVLTGILAGGAMGFQIVTFLAPAPATTQSIGLAVVVGAVIGGVVLALLFDWALVFLSAVLGAFLVIEPFYHTAPLSELMFVILAVAGMFVQARGLVDEE